MTKVTLSEVYSLAKLASLSLSEDEATQIQQELSEILSFVEQLSQVDISGLEPTYQVTGLSNVSRPDEIIDYGVSPEMLLKNAPDSQEGSIKVKRVL